MEKEHSRWWRGEKGRGRGRKVEKQRCLGRKEDRGREGQGGGGGRRGGGVNKGGSTHNPACVFPGNVWGNQ